MAELKREMKNRVFEVPTNKIKISKWDVRVKKEDERAFDALKKSIDAGGLLHPLTVIPDKKGYYTLVAGRRRLRACKELGIKMVPVFLKTDDSKQEESELRTVTVIENLHRRELGEYEKCYGILSIYESAGYTKAQAIEGNKSIDNWFSNHTDHKVNWQKFMSLHNSVVLTDTKEGRPTKSDLGYDQKFVKISRSVGYSPKYQYQILQKTRDLTKKTLMKADEAGLSGQKVLMLTHSGLRDHPKLQEKLINELAEKPVDEARDRVYQTVSDLQTGALIPEGSTYVRADSQRDKISDKTVLSQATKASRIRGNCKKLIQTLTGQSVPKTKVRYESSHVEKGRDWQVDIVKTIDEGELTQLEANLVIAKEAVDQMLGLIDKEFESRKQKQEMISK